MKIPRLFQATLLVMSFLIGSLDLAAQIEGLGTTDPPFGYPSGHPFREWAAGDSNPEPKD